MSGFKELDFFKRQEAAAIAKKAALEKFRAKAADPALADRLKERTARAAERKAIKDAREVEKAENWNMEQSFLDKTPQRHALRHGGLADRLSRFARQDSGKCARSGLHAPQCFDYKGAKIENSRLHHAADN
jgi:hypothetical protein